MRHRQHQERLDRRAAFAGWLLVNVHRDSEKKREPFDLAEVTAWLGYAATYVAPARPVVAESPPTPEELRRKFETVYALHQAMQGQNGTEEG